MNPLRCAAIFVSTLAISGCAADGVADQCIVGETEACACTDGSSGAQQCREDGSFATCVCDGAVPAPAPAPEDPVPLADCEDGSFDPGDTCAVAPNTRGLYLLGTTAEGSCGADALQQFWPNMSPDYRSGFDCYGNWYHFRSDGALYYQATFSGIHADGGGDPVIATEPCGDMVGRQFGFDGNGTLFYQCGDELYGHGGDLITPVTSYVGTLSDGRHVALVASETQNRDEYVILDPDGEELSRLVPDDTLGAMTPVAGGGSFYGDTAYVLFRRTSSNDDGEEINELISYRVDKTNGWQPSRRVTVESFGSTQFVLSDGTAFTRERDPLTTFDERILVHSTNNTSDIAWREATAGQVKAHIGNQLLLGPML